MTYKKDSTVINSFGRMVPKSDRAIEAFSKGHWLNFTIDSMIDLNAFENREHDIAWMVSNCHTESKREELVDALKNSLGNTLQINVYGKCGSLRLPTNTYSTIGN